MSASPQPTVRDHPEAQRFEVLDATGSVAGFAAYQRHESEVVFTHTQVDPAYEGRGLGSTLVRGALDVVRGEGLQVVPRCPFVSAFIERHEEYADLTA